MLTKLLPIGLVIATLVIESWAAARLAAQQVPAFPGAEGAGMFATGGRGGQVVHVTNLNANGPGSLADAVSESDRIVVFDVSGIIDLTSRDGKHLQGGRIVLGRPNITIAGQTAPGEGICLKGGVLQISANNVIVRHLRSRRGWVIEADTGDALAIKPPSAGEQTTASGRSEEVFRKIQEKKKERGKILKEFADLSNVIIDHCSTSWGTDENLTASKADRTTVSWCIAAEGCDYPNPKQTPPNHSEGSLWGSGAPDGRSTMHHMLYAHNRLRNPRTTGGADVPPVLSFYNCVVYNWSEYPSHTGSERVLLNWLNNYYRAGPDTPTGVRSRMFEFHGDPGARIFARGNFIHGSPEATANNRLAIAHDRKFDRLDAAQRQAMIVDAPLADAPRDLQIALDAFEAVLADAGATLPSRDAVDLRITDSVRSGTGHVINKETDLPPGERWPEYYSLTPPPDSDADGMPDYWERQLDLDPNDPQDSTRLSRGYANIEHYFNSTDPTGSRQPVVYVAASRSRAAPNEPGEWRIVRNGDVSLPLTVSYGLSGDAQSGKDFQPLSGSVTIEAGKTWAPVALVPRPGTRPGAKVVLSLIGSQSKCHVGCPAESLIVLRKASRS